MPVAAASVWILAYLMLPHGASPYYTNADCTAVMNKGVTFGKHLLLFTQQDAARADGLFASTTNEQSGGSVSVVAQEGGGWKIDATRFYQPLLHYFAEGESYRLMNPIFPAAISKGKFLAGHNDSISILSIKPHDEGHRKPSYQYDISLSASLHTPEGKAWNDNLTIEDCSLNKGLDIYTLLCKKARPVHEETRPILESFVQDLGECFIIARRDGNGDSLSFFPSAQFSANGYSYYSRDLAQKEIVTTYDTISRGQRFFVGLADSRNTLYLDTAGSGSMLRFNRPKYFALKASSEERVIGELQSRFLCNHYSDILEASGKEGFLFHEDLRPATGNRITATMSYAIGKPGQPLAYTVQDNIANKTLSGLGDSRFSLRTASGKHEWLFEVRDFSKNNYSLLWAAAYISILFLLMLATVFYNPSRTLQKIELVLYAILLAFLTLRYLLLWRVATFPPLEGITNNELDLLTGYDNKVGTYDLHSSSTFWACVLFLGLLNLVRGGWMRRLLQKSGRSRLAGWAETYPLWTQAIGLIVCGGILLFIRNELVVRLAGIFMPVLLYLFLSALVVRKGLRYTPTESALVRKPFLKRALRLLHPVRETPVFYLTLLTTAFLFLSDRGFAVLFLLFVLFKNVLYNFLRFRVQRGSGSGANGSTRTGQSYFYPAYGIAAFLVYAAFIGWKPLFFYLLQYKVYLLQGGLLLAIALLLITRYGAGPASPKPWSRGVKIALASLCLFLFGLLTVSHAYADAWLNKHIRHVMYRASIIYQPLDAIIAKSSYQSFEERKIIATAEGQWFISSYLDKDYDQGRRINLRPHFSGGVDYVTQTRDVVLPRFVISELGKGTMGLMLALLMLPMLLYFSSYRIADAGAEGRPFIAPSYAPGLAVIMLFTLGFFVWLSATNRFVFFGQDFPFISLSSKMSILLPLALLFAVLSATPEKLHSVRTRVNKRLRIMLGAVVIIMLLISYPSNQLKAPNFNPRLAHTEHLLEEVIDPEFARIQRSLGINVAAEIPDEIDLRNMVVSDTLQKALTQLCASEAYKRSMDTADEYSRSLLEILRSQPNSTRRAESPLFLRFDRGRYHIVANKRLHLELPAYDNKTAWKGNIYESSDKDTANTAIISIGGKSVEVHGKAGRCHTPSAQVLAGVIPAAWTSPAYLKTRGFSGDALAIISGRAIGSETENHRLAIQIRSKDGRRQIINQTLTGYATVMDEHDIATVFEGGGQSCAIMLSPAGGGGGNRFGANYWVNGRQRMMYPLGAGLYWAREYADAVRWRMEAQDSLSADASITLDWKLSDTIGRYFQTAFVSETATGFKFGVVAADGLGRIRLMADYVANRETLDPNNEDAIARVARKEAFFRDTRDEIDQWGNTNLVRFSYGPGSSIKPLAAAAVASQINAGWEHLVLEHSDRFTIEAGKDGSGRQLYATPEYAGLRLPRGQEWKEQHFTENGHTDILHYISKSSNLYQSLIMFLGSYPADSFRVAGGAPSLFPLLTPTIDSYNHYPVVTMNGAGPQYYLRPFRSGGWPASLQSGGYFGNETSVLANGFSRLLKLTVSDQNKGDFSSLSYRRKNFAEPVYDLLINDSLTEKSPLALQWAFPEEAFFMQADRSADERYENFNKGLRMPTSGGSPYMLTPLKMAEMYGSLVSQNEGYRIHVAGPPNGYKSWPVNTKTSGWSSLAQYQDFLQGFLFEGMKQVLTEGTLTELYNKVAMHNGYHLYAKTGTISEAAVKSNSKMVALIISKGELKPGTAFESDRFYTVYFTNEAAGSTHRYKVINRIIDAIMASPTFTRYMETGK